MRKAIAVTAAAFALAASSPVFAKGSHAVRGHVTKRGSYVQPHRATNRDSTKTNNYSQKGNVNPNTGKKGTKD